MTDRYEINRTHHGEPQSLKHLRQFILYRDDKTPISPHTLAPCDPHDQINHASYEDVHTLARSSGLGVGFVLTAADPYFCVDLDDCYNADGTPKHVANDIVGLLPNARIEFSKSGRGLHIFGTYAGDEPAHKCKNTAHKIELYTSSRYIALTENWANDADVNQVFDLAPLINKYFPPSTSASPEWTEGHCTGYNGPFDDDELIAKALASKASFGRISFRDFWEANADQLARYYPSQNSRDAWDGSSVDAAFAAHLAFWTGGDCARIERLMRRSGLVRPKWDREGYMFTTISGAVRVQSDYYKAPSAPVERPEIDPASMVPQLLGSSGYMPVAEQIDHFAGCVYVTSEHRIGTPDGYLLKPEQFRATYGGFEFEMDAEPNGKTEKNAWSAFTESRAVRFPKADTCEFRPELPPLKIYMDGDSPVLNTYHEVQVESEPGDVGPFLRHLEKLLPEAHDREILLAYMAAVVQHKGVKFQFAPLLQGVQGNGKTLFTRALMAAVGSKYSHIPNANDIDNKFNAWLLGKVFIGVEDIYVPGGRRELMETLKPMITNEVLEIQAKGGDQRTRRVCANFLFNSNHKDAIKKTDDERRFAVFYTAQQTKEDLARDGMDDRYFKNLYDWFKSRGAAYVTNYLNAYQIPVDLNPANGIRAPRTSTTDDAIAESRSPLENAFLEAVEDGRQGFKGAWVSSHALEVLVSEIGHRLSRPQLSRLLESYGYVRHPALPEGKSTKPTLTDGKRCRLYVRSGSPACALASDRVAHEYDVAQGSVPMGVSVSGEAV